MQHLTLCGVGAHQQNGVYGRIIKDLNLSSRTLVLCDQCYWPEYITTVLWSFALFAYEDTRNNPHVDMNDKTPEIKWDTQACLIIYIGHSPSHP